MILNNVKLVDSDKLINVKINGGLIVEVSIAPIIAIDDLQIDFQAAIIFPGLINSHDHLDFNLFAQLGNRTYNNYTEWGKHIHGTYADEIKAVLNIPVALRVQWGIYKNLLCGITTVVNHGEKLGTNADLINVFEETHCIHSIGFEKRWKIKLNNPLKKNLPVNIHAGEGNDEQAHLEIDQLIRWNLLKRKLVGVHAVAMTKHQAKKFKAIVWCPESNYFLLNKTAPINLLKDHTDILFGTDSTLTGDWDIWNHLQSARKSRLLNNENLYNSLTINPAKIWKLNSGEILAGKDADIVIAGRKNNKTGLDAFYLTTPADLLLVIQKGKIRLFDETLLDQFKGVDTTDFSKILVNGVCKYVQGDLPGLMAKIRKYNPAANLPKNITKAAYLWQH